MRRIIRPTVCVLALCGLFLWAPIASGQGHQSATGPQQRPTNSLFCIAHSPSQAYYSGVFVSTGRIPFLPEQAAFLEFLKQNYKGPGQIPNTISCGYALHSLAEAQSVERRYINSDRQNKRNVIETGWTYGSAAPAETAPAPEQSSAGASVSTDAVRSTTGTNPAQPSNQSPQVPATPSTVTNQQLNANSALVHALIVNNPAACVSAIEQGAQVNSLYHGDTMLNEAAMLGSLAVTRCLVEHGADVNAVGEFAGQHIPATLVAAEKGHVDIMSYLVEKGADPNVIAPNNESLLMLTIANHGHIDSVKFLLEHGADVNYTRQGSHGPETALTFAQGLHHREEVEYLRAHGAH